MRYDAVLFDNGGTLTHRTSPVAAVGSLAARLGRGHLRGGRGPATGAGPRSTAGP